MLKLTKRPKTPGITSKKIWLDQNTGIKSKKNMAFPEEGNKLFPGDPRANLN